MIVLITSNSVWKSDLKGNYNCDSFDQNSGKGHNKSTDRCDLLQHTGVSVGMDNEEQGTEETDEECDEQDITECPIISLEN